MTADARWRSWLIALAASGLVILVGLVVLGFVQPGFHASEPEEAERSLGATQGWASAAERTRDSPVGAVLIGFALAFPVGAAAAAIRILPRALQRAKEGR